MTMTSCGSAGAEYRGVVNYYLLAQDVWRLHALCWNAETSMRRRWRPSTARPSPRLAARYKAKATTGDGQADML